MKKSYYVFTAIIALVISLAVVGSSDAAFWGKKVPDKKTCAAEYKSKCNKKCSGIESQSERSKCFSDCEKNLGEECGYTPIQEKRKEENRRTKRYLY